MAGLGLAAATVLRVDVVTDGKALIFYQERAKFGARYDNFAFFDAAQLDDGSMWTTALAFTELSAADEVIIAALVRRATGN